MPRLPSIIAPEVGAANDPYVAPTAKFPRSPFPIKEQLRTLALPDILITVTPRI